MHIRQGSYVAALVVLLTCVGVIGGARPAHADPHAVFYTAVGQRQLFFNILAGLNQADYVEPATGPNSRQEALDRRAAAGFGPETEDVIDKSGTNLASLLTRSITLEGDDLWTAYLTHNFALEIARRKDVADVIKVYCERGLGIKECDPAKAVAEPEKQARLDTTSFVKKAYEFDTNWLLGGLLGVALSGRGPSPDLIIPDPSNNLQPIPFPGDEALREKLLRADKAEKGSKPPAWQYSAPFAIVRALTAGTPLADLFETGVATTVLSFVPGQYDPYALAHIALNNGQFELTYSLDNQQAFAPATAVAAADPTGCQGTVSPSQFQYCYFRDLLGSMGNSSALFSELETGLTKQQQDERLIRGPENQLAQYQLNPGKSITDKSGGGELRPELGAVSQTTRRAYAEEAALELGRTSVARLSVDPSQYHDPAAVVPPGVAGATTATGTPAGQVQGTQQGQVLAAGSPGAPRRPGDLIPNVIDDPYTKELFRIIVEGDTSHYVPGVGTVPSL